MNPTLLGTVTRTDLPGLGPVRQVTYAGLPLYLFFLDQRPGETEGANLFDPVTSPTGIWYLVQPSSGPPAPGQAQLQLETAPVGGTGSDRTVLAATMNPDFSGFPQARFPVYTLSPDNHKSACRGVCAAVYWPPVLTSGATSSRARRRPARPGNHRQARRHPPGHLQRPAADPFYTNVHIPGLPYNNGMASINGAGAHTPWGVFKTIPPLP